jgi:hypothetical protein
LQADWEFELGEDAPLIDAHWPGFVDLRRQPEHVDQIAEASQFSGLADVLVALNDARSPVWSSKCDVWDVGDFDVYELDAPPELVTTAVACYIDLLAKNERAWATPELAERACRAICDKLSAVPLRGCRADLVIRTARISADNYTLGLTVYLVGCGASDDAARVQLSHALAAFVGSLQAAPTDVHASSQ